MADPTPPSDIPDPASPTPSSSVPGSRPASIVPVPTGEPKRIRSMPDRPTGARPVGSIRSLPDQSRGSVRMAGTYADSLGKEKSWARGLGILWTLFLLTMLMEAFNAACYLLAGKVEWPPVSHLMFGSTAFMLPVEAGRLALVCTIFIGLWAGWGWLRYLLATVDFLSGLWLIVGMIASYHAMPKFKATHESDVPIYWPVESMPKIALGILYLATAAYVIFSVDVREFVAHRRARGRVWSALLVTVVSYGAMILILGAQPIYNLWLRGQRASAQAFGEDTLRTMSNSWAADSIDARIDPDFAKAFTKDGRKATFGNFSALGRLQAANAAPPTVITTVDPHPLQNIVPAPADVRTGVTKDGYSFQVLSRYHTTGAVFEHGKVGFGFDLVRDLFGPWRVAGLDAVNVSIDRPHPAAGLPAPGATPGSADPAAPSQSAAPSPGVAPSPSLAPAPGTLLAPPASPAAAPTAPAATVPSTVAPMPSLPVAPVPAASATPATTQVPTTGG